MRYGREGDGPRFAIVVMLVTLVLAIAAMVVITEVDPEQNIGPGLLVFFSVPAGLLLGLVLEEIVTRRVVPRPGVLVALATVALGTGVAAVTWLLDDDPRGGHGALALLSVPLGLVLGTLAQWLAVLRRR